MHGPDHHPRRPADEIVLTISGMHCTNCALSLEKHLNRVGAQTPTVDFATGRTTFRLADRNRLKEIIESIARLGYTVADDGPSHGPSRHSALLIKTAVSALLTAPLLLAMFTGSATLHDPLLQGILATPVFLIGLHHFG